MRIVSLIVPFFLYAGVKSTATEDEKLWTQMFKRWIRNACKPDNTTIITASCVNTLIGDEQLTTLRTADDHYAYKMNWQNNDSTTTVFEFEQENDPFTETEEQESLTVAKWGGANILNNADFKSTFRKVRQKVFRWLNDKHNVTTDTLSPTGRRRRDTDEEMDAAVDDGFDDFIVEINDLTKSHGRFNPEFVNFVKVKPTIAPPPHVQTTTPCNQFGHVPSNYAGTISIAKSGKTCQKWTSQHPHEHERTPEGYPGEGLGNHNYCRNPDNEPEGSWCYTTDPNSRWEYCNCEVNECEKNIHNCDIHATCADTIGSFTCTCNIGFEGDGVNCNDVIECEQGHDCSINGQCTNTIGSHTCACNSGFLGDGKLCTVPCATFYDSYPTFNEGGESFSTGKFEVSNLATIDTGNQQEAVTNWKPSGSWNDKVSYVQVEPKCKLEAFNHDDYSQLTGSWRGSESLPNGHEMREGRENDKISSYKCTCSRESCESYYMFGKDVPKGCQVPKCDVVTYSLTDSWRRKQGNQMKYGFALNVAIPEEYWNEEGWSLLVRFNGVDVNSGSFQIWNANFFNFFRKSNAFEILIHQKHFTGNDLADKHSFVLIVDKMTMSDLPEFYFFTDRQKKHQCFDRSMHQRSITNFHGAIESSSKTDTYEDVSYVAMTRTGEFRVRV